MSSRCHPAATPPFFVVWLLDWSIVQDGIDKINGRKHTIWIEIYGGRKTASRMAQRMKAAESLHHFRLFSQGSLGWYMHIYICVCVCSQLGSIELITLMSSRKHMRLHCLNSLHNIQFYPFFSYYIFVLNIFSYLNRWTNEYKKFHNNN